MTDIIKPNCEEIFESTWNKNIGFTLIERELDDSWRHGNQ
jgi:hypothetical protein